MVLSLYSLHAIHSLLTFTLSPSASLTLSSDHLSLFWYVLLLYLLYLSPLTVPPVLDFLYPCIPLIYCPTLSLSISLPHHIQSFMIFLSFHLFNLFLYDPHKATSPFVILTSIFRSLHLSNPFLLVLHPCFFYFCLALFILGLLSFCLIFLSCVHLTSSLTSHPPPSPYCFFSHLHF